jgi:hypothetical protein
MGSCSWKELAQAAYQEVYGEQFICNPNSVAQKRKQRKQVQKCRVAVLREAEQVAKDLTEARSASISGDNNS